MCLFQHVMQRACEGLKHPCTDCAHQIKAKKRAIDAKLQDKLMTDTEPFEMVITQLLAELGSLENQPDGRISCCSFVV
ncbi:hypothetical protein B5M09_007693 [Aphanomyces astaci]|uniref:Uncharacterized protein n=1 Tax=Aphanomyces astaci TaxID=112090 RepID=A0A3R7YEM2_APHAT|nr:hypothetical protein B5M09_007693 [Aphanomyces astaci]